MTIATDAAQFSRALRSAILWPAGAILLAALLMVVAIVALFKDFAWSDHSYQILVQARVCENLSLTRQNSVRGYLLTGNPAFLAPVDKDGAQIHAAFVKLQALVQNNPEQAIRAGDLLDTEEMWLNHSTDVVAQRKAGVPTNPAWVQEGKDLMDSLVLKFDRFTAVEENLHEQRLLQVRHMKESLGYGGTGLAIILSLAVGQMVRRQFGNLETTHRSALNELENRHAALARSETDLEEQKEWFRVTLLSIRDGVFVTDGEGRIVFLNHAAERLTGWTSMEALLKPAPTVFRIVDATTRVAMDDPIARVIRKEETTGLGKHALLLSRTGEEIAIEDSAAPILDAKKGVMGVVMVFRDATLTRQAEVTLKAHSAELEKKVAERTALLEQAVAELKTFSYTVSHDLRAPLRAMEGFAQAVQEDYQDKLDDRGRNYLNRIVKASQRLDRLIQDMLSYTRMSRPDEPLVALDVDKILREIIEHYPTLYPPAAEVSIEGTLPRVMGLESPLTQVLSNLLGNAAKFVAPGVSARMRVWSEDRGPLVRIWIEDNGIGIEPENQERIFQMFVQLNDANLHAGTGAGLSIVKKAMGAMRGTVGVESEKGKGSRFWIELTRATS